ncbi:DUF2971 domain-containing protein [Catalinimonas niigatensis]|uniref:DUF2971 domain-containing protein n=1 Tax=Catalinimonas niigatensis TaxID=1397264 RepID=UPI00266549DD|nr:DUF2971 domain-containing protein [Catalinimonas niigatensis]WPP49398.1 DUF2971 domain-containing protein [Catalinimonas niigatensis]
MDEYLYHYTDANGLVGILTEGKLRASHFGYMNDGQELIYYILNFLNPATTTFINEKALSEKLFEKFKEHYRINNPFFQPFSANLFITSFSEEGNDLSMWRSYTPQGGFSIGFAKEGIKSLVSKNEEFSQCKYIDRNSEKLSATEYVREVFQRPYVLKELSKENSNGFQNVMNYLKREYSFQAVNVKNIEFSHEKEWRLCYFIKSNDDKIKFRTKGQLIIPYIEIDLTKFIDKVQIAIGPGPYYKMQYSYMSYLGFKSKFQLSVKGTNHNYRNL